MLRKLFAWLQKYERHLSVLATLGGFGIDQVFFGRIDITRTQVLLAAYTLITFVSILLYHWFEERAQEGKPRPRWRSLLPIITQFMLGGYWSAFFFFYGHSAALPASWPFLLLILVMLIGNEYFAKYHSRLVFASVLYFFALYSYAIFEVPIVVGKMSTAVFLLSSLVAVGAFALFTTLLRVLGHRRFKKDIWRIRVGAFVVLALMGAFYFTNILPPLPLSVKAAGVYHSVWRVPGDYLAAAEPEPWTVRYLGATPTLHVVPNESLYAYTEVFAPTALTTTIVHEWQRYATSTNAWQTVAAVSYPIVGGRDGGYRGYTAKANITPGRYRVNVKTIDGRLIARIPFTVEAAATTTLETIALP